MFFLPAVDVTLGFLSCRRRKKGNKMQGKKYFDYSSPLLLLFFYYYCLLLLLLLLLLFPATCRQHDMPLRYFHRRSLALCGRCSTVLGAFAKMRKATINFVMSVRPSAWNNSVPTRRIFIKCDSSVFFENMSRKFKFH